jgi:hypothetical protein
MALASFGAAFILHCYDYELWQDVFTGIFSAIILIIVLEWRDHKRDRKIYGTLEGTYKRVAFKLPDRMKTYDTIYKDVPFIPAKITLQYKGLRRYSFDAQYDEGLVRGTFHTDEHSADFGTGIYQYVSKPDVDLGTYNYYRDQVNTKLLYVLHENILPSGLAEGLEIWERQ